MARKNVSTRTPKAASGVILSWRTYSLNERNVAICRGKVENSKCSQERRPGLTMAPPPYWFSSVVRPLTGEISRRVLFLSWSALRPKSPAPRRWSVPRPKSIRPDGGRRARRSCCRRTLQPNTRNAPRFRKRVRTRSAGCRVICGGLRADAGAGRAAGAGVRGDGHSTIEQTRQYAQIVEPLRREAAARMEAFMRGDSS